MRLRDINLPQHMIVVVSAWASRVVTTFVQLVSIRVLMDSLGLQNYAVFALLTGLAGWFMLADIGIGVSVQNYISESRAKSQSYDNIINAGALLALMLLCLTLFALHIASPYAAQFLLKNFTTLGNEEKTKLFFMSGALSIATCLSGIIYKIWYAELKGYLSNILPAIASLIGLVGLLFVKQYSTQESLLLSLTVFIAPTSILPFAALVRRCLKYSHKYSLTYLPGTTLKIIKRGLHFWLFSVIGAGVLQVDYIVLSQFLTAHDIVIYNLATKIFGMAFFAYSSALLALWPIFSESIVMGNWKIVEQYLKKYVFWGLAFMFTCTMLLTWLMPILVEMLAPKEIIVIPLGFILLLGVYQMIRVWTDIFTTILGSMNDINSFFIYVPIQVIISLILQWTLVPIIGIYGIVIGLIGSFLLTAVWILPLRVRRNYMSRDRLLTSQ